MTTQYPSEDMDIVNRDVTPIDTERKIDRSNKYANEKLDEEIRRLLQCVGEVRNNMIIFRYKIINLIKI